MEVGSREAQVRHELRGSLALGLVRATEMAAMAAARHIGRGDMDRARSVAASAMLAALEALDFRGRVVIGPRGDGVLSYGTTVGSGDSLDLDLAVYPVEGASLLARGQPNAVSLIVACEPGGFPSLPAVSYIEKLVAGAGMQGTLDIEDPIGDNLRRVAFARNARVSDLNVAVLDRPRHQELVEEIRRTGARLTLLEDGDIAGALATATEGSGIDLMAGVGGLQEAMVAGCGVRCLGGEIQGKLWPRNDEERILAGADAGQVYSGEHLAPHELAMAVTGISGGPLLRQVTFKGLVTETSSLLLSSRLGTVRWMQTRHLNPEPV